MRQQKRFFQRAIDATDAKPERVSTDEAKCYPPALRVVLLDAEHRISKEFNNGIDATMDISNNGCSPCVGGASDIR